MVIFRREVRSSCAKRDGTHFFPIAAFSGASNSVFPSRSWKDLLFTQEGRFSVPRQAHARTPTAIPEGLALSIVRANSVLLFCTCIKYLHLLLTLCSVNT